MLIWFVGSTVLVVNKAPVPHARRWVTLYTYRLWLHSGQAPVSSGQRHEKVGEGDTLMTNQAPMPHAVHAQGHARWSSWPPSVGQEAPNHMGASPICQLPFIGLMDTTYLCPFDKAILTLVHPMPFNRTWLLDLSVAI